MKHPSPDLSHCADRWYRLFENEHVTLIRLDVPPRRDEHVNSLAQSLTQLAGRANGRMTLDLTVVEDYSWVWIRALIDLSSVCMDLGGALCLQGMNAEGTRLFASNKSMVRSALSHGRGPPRDDMLPIGGRTAQPQDMWRARRMARSAA